VGVAFLSREGSGSYTLLCILPKSSFGILSSKVCWYSIILELLYSPNKKSVPDHYLNTARGSSELRFAPGNRWRPSIIPE